MTREKAAELENAVLHTHGASHAAREKAFAILDKLQAGVPVSNADLIALAGAVAETHIRVKGAMAVAA